MARLFQGEGPAHHASDAGKGLQGDAYTEGDGTHSHVGSPVIGNHVCVQVVASEIHRIGRVANEDSAMHFPIHPLRFSCQESQKNHTLNITYAAYTKDFDMWL